MWPAGVTFLPFKQGNEKGDRPLPPQAGGKPLFSSSLRNHACDLFLTLGLTSEDRSGLLQYMDTK